MITLSPLKPTCARLENFKGRCECVAALVEVTDPAVEVIDPAADLDRLQIAIRGMVLHACIRLLRPWLDYYE